MSEESQYDKARQILKDRQVAYKLLLGNAEDGTVKAVLADLKKFCRSDETTFHPDARVHAHLEGRREVILRIFDHLNLKLDDLCKKYLEGKADA